MKLKLFFLIIIVPLLNFGQNFSISGKVVDLQNKPISFVNVLVLVASDSTLVKGTSTDDFGVFKVSELEKGDYILQYSFIGYKTVSRTIFLDEDLTVEDVVLEEDIESLGEVSIIAKRPTVRKEADKLVFDVQNTALIEGDMLQVIRSTPGVLVLDNGISIKGESPTVYINNRKVQIGPEELIQLLESSSANSIKTIEVITNPSAKYDAETSSVINIIMSKNLITGYRGSLFNNFTQGVFPRYNIGTSHFFKTSKINLNLNYSYTKSKINRDQNDKTNFLDGNNVTDEIWKSNINRNTWSNTHNVDLYFDYFIDDHNTLSFTSTLLYLPEFEYRINNNTVITDENNTFNSRFDANNLSHDKKHNLGFDLGYVHQFEKKGSLSFNGHFTTYDYNRFQEVKSDYYDENNVFDRATAYNTEANQNTKIYTSKMDYELPINEQSLFELGAKYSHIKTESDIQQFDVDLVTGDEQIDQQNSDAFNYKEYVFAAYSNYSLDIEKWNLNLGLRAEQSNNEGKSISIGQVNKQDYFEWFPNASVQYIPSDSFDIYANYKRSLTRPYYTELNPFRFFLNDNTIVTGNPQLQPTFNDHYVIGTTLLGNLTFEAYYQNYDGNVSELARQNNNTNIVEYVPVNVDKTVEFGFDFATYFDLVDSWSVYFVTSFYNIEEETDFGEGFVKQDQWSNYTVLQNDFSLLKDRSLSANITLTWIGKNLQGLTVVEDRLDSNLSISKRVLKNKGVVSITVSDLFNMQNYDLSTVYLNQFNTSYRDIDNRYIKLGFRYKFGNTKLETNARTSEQEERDRLKDLN